MHLDSLYPAHAYLSFNYHPSCGYHWCSRGPWRARLHRDAARFYRQCRSNARNNVARRTAALAHDFGAACANACAVGLERRTLSRHRNFLQLQRQRQGAVGREISAARPGLPWIGCLSRSASVPKGSPTLPERLTVGHPATRFSRKHSEGFPSEAVRMVQRRNSIGLVEVAESCRGALIEKSRETALDRRRYGLGKPVRWGAVAEPNALISALRQDHTFGR